MTQTAKGATPGQVKFRFPCCRGVAYFIGSQDYRQPITIDGDLLVIDEVDGHLQENIPVLEQRIEHSNLRWRLYASTRGSRAFG